MDNIVSVKLVLQARNRGALETFIHSFTGFYGGLPRAGKQHKNVLADIRSLIDQGVICELNFQPTSVPVKMPNGGYRQVEAYNLDFDATMVLATGYDAHRRMAIISRWKELESGEAVSAQADAKVDTHKKPIDSTSREQRKMAYSGSNNNNEPTMSSLQFVEILKDQDVRHDSIKRTMERLKERGVINFTPMVGNSEGRGRPVTVYHVNERDSYVVMAQLSPEFTARLVDEWKKLKEAEPAQVDFNDPSVLRTMLIDYTQKLEAETARADELKRTKAHIQANRDATSFALAGRLTQENKRLKREMDIKENYKATKAIPWVKEYFEISSGMWIMLGKALSQLGRSMGYTIHETDHPKYPGKIKMHHKDVIAVMKQILDMQENPYHLGQFRK